MPNSFRNALVAALLALAPWTARGLDPVGPVDPAVDEIERCVDRNSPTSARQTLVFDRVDATGGSRELVATAIFKRGPKDKVRFLLRIEEPAAERGSALLGIEREDSDVVDLWTYLPELRQVRRITANTLSGSLFGTDFSYEDVMEMQRESQHARVERRPDGTFEGRPVAILAAKPATDSGSQYSEVIAHFDRETCVLLHAELYGHSGDLAKQLDVAWADVEKQGERWVPKKVTMRDLGKKTESQIHLRKAEWNADLPDRLFSQGELAKGH
jgi:hypothetical protein